MRPYGQKRCEAPGRIVRGVVCQCCCRHNPRDKITKRALKKRARQQGKVRDD